MKRTVAILTLFAMLLGCMSFGLSVSAADALGTYDDPMAPTEFYGMYLLNNTLEEGDSDGIWYSFAAPSAGIVSVENAANDADGNRVYDYQLVVEIGDKRYYANDTVFSNPVSTLRVTKGTEVKIGMWALPDEEGNIPSRKMYVSLDMVTALDSDPVRVKSADGFTAPVGSNKTVCYLDGSTAGVYAGKGVILEGPAEAVANATVTYGTTEYVDFDGDGKIEFSFPAATDGAMIAPHYAFSITNGSAVDAVFVLRLVDNAKEGYFEPSTGHAVECVPSVDPTCLEAGMQEYWYCSVCDKYYENDDCTVETTAEALLVEATGHDFVEGACTACGEPEPAYTLGDINADGDINGKDSNTLKKFVSGSLLPTQTEKMASDVNFDGEINGKDSNILTQFVSGSISGF